METEPIKQFNYIDYLQSEYWKNKRMSLIQERKCCEVCGCISKLCVHHISYKNIGNEEPSDLIVLCNMCHHKLHFNKDKRLPLFEDKLKERLECMKQKAKGSKVIYIEEIGFNTGNLRRFKMKSGIGSKYAQPLKTPQKKRRWKK